MNWLDPAPQRCRKERQIQHKKQKSRDGALAQRQREIDVVGEKRKKKEEMGKGVAYVKIDTIVKNLVAYTGG